MSTSSSPVQPAPYSPLPSAIATGGDGDVARIAVVAVHGVADQKPGETATQIAGLLLGLGTDGKARFSGKGRLSDEQKSACEPALYAGFEAQQVQLPLRPLAAPVYPEHTGAPAPQAAGRASLRQSVELGMLQARKSLGMPFKERRGFFDDVHAVRPPADKTQQAQEDKGTVSYEFLRLQLASYQSGNLTRAYVTERLAGRRVAPRSQDGRRTRSADVHVYEMYWADLSRLAKGPLAFLGTLFQLGLHIATLGRQALDAARVEHPGFAWRLLQNAHTYLIRLLVLFIPVLNFVLLLTGLAPLSALKIRGSAAGWIATVAMAVLAVLATYGLIRPHWKPKRTWLWSLAPFLAAAVGALLAIGLVSLARSLEVSDGTLLLVEWWIAAGIVLGIATFFYERVRQGALFVGAASFAIAVVTFVLCHMAADARGLGPRTVETSSVWTMQVLFSLLGLCWGALYVCSTVAFACGLIVVLRERFSKQRDAARYARTRAALRTVKLTGALAVSAYLFTIIVIWSGVYRFVISRTGVYACMPATMVPLPAALEWMRMLVPSPDAIGHWLPGSSLSAPESCATLGPALLTARQYFGGLLAKSITTGLWLAMALLGIGLFLLGWMALPSGLEELEPAPSTCENARTERAGAWLSRGMNATSLVAWCAWGATFVVIPVFAILDWLARVRAERALAVPTPESIGFGVTFTLFFVRQAGALLTASALALITALAKYGGSALDILLDVDNYLRTQPVESTPVARIAERYASLLRYIARYSDRGRGYDAVVIIAHSLGTAITADVLRVLTRQRASAPDDELAPFGFADAATTPSIPIYFFSMGSPLRQLMNRFFPHRFWWVRESPDGEARAAGASEATTANPATANPPLMPDPSQLNVALWANAYRSGDYVGRGLWLDEWYARTAGRPEEGGYPDAISALASPGNRWEACIGLGAHTHYWDATAPDIAEKLDVVVAQAIGAAGARQVV